MKTRTYINDNMYIYETLNTKIDNLSNLVEDIDLRMRHSTDRAKCMSLSVKIHRLKYKLYLLRLQNK
jgi:hypothetical protein